MGKLQDVTRFLLAAGGSASADGKSTHLFHEENNKLFMETWTGSEISNRQQVVTGVRTDTSAPLVSLHYNRIFVVDQTHTLKCFTETKKAEDEHDSDDEEEEEDTVWEDEELDNLDIKVHDKSQLAVSCGEFTIVVFYQNPDGTIGAIEDDGGHHGWKIAQLPNSEALPGTPMASFQAKDTVYFVYVAADQTFRYMEHSNNEWKDAPFSSAKIEGAIAKISLAEDEKAESDPKLLIFCLADDKLSTIKPGSTEAETWGTVEDGVYKPTSDQENNGSPQGSIPIPFHPGSLFIYSSGPPPPAPPPVVPAFFPVASPFACYEDFGQLTLRDDPEYQQPLYRTQPPPPYENAYGRFDGRYYESHDEPMLRQSVPRPNARSGPQPHYDPSWQGPYQHPYRARDMYQQDPYQRDPYYQDRYPQDYYQQDPYQRDPPHRDPYQRGPYSRDPNQPPPQDFSRQQDPPQGLPRQQQGPLQETSQQQQQQPSLQELQRQQQAPPQEVQSRQEPAHRSPTVESDDDDDNSPPRPQPPPQTQTQTQRQPAPVPNPEETQQGQQQQQHQQQRPISPTVKSEDDGEPLRRRRPQMEDRRARDVWGEETAEFRQAPRRRTTPDSAFDEDEDEFLQQFRRYRREALERDRQDELRRTARQEMLERERQEEDLRRARQEEERRRAHQEDHSRARRPPPQHRGFDYDPHHPYLGHGFDDHSSLYRGAHRTRADPIIKFRTYHYITSMRCEKCHRRYKRVNRGLPFGRSHEWVKKCRC